MSEQVKYSWLIVLYKGENLFNSVGRLPHRSSNTAVASKSRYQSTSLYFFIVLSLTYRDSVTQTHQKFGQTVKALVSRLQPRKFKKVVVTRAGRYRE